MLNVLREIRSMEHKEAGCQPPESPILCTNNCGFFGSAATMNMCSKCHKEMVLKQEQAKLAASSIDSIVHGIDSGREPVVPSNSDIAVSPVQTRMVTVLLDYAVGSSEGGSSIAEAKEEPNRCNTCRKRIGLMGFDCRCGNLFCATHRYSDKHNCPFDYRTEARDAIAKANPIVKAKKLDKV